MRRCLIVGGDSAIGAGLRRHLVGEGYDVSWTSRRPGSRGFFLDLTTLDGLADMPAADLVVIAAAETKIEVCAREPRRTSQINVSAPIAVAKRAAEFGARVLFLSSIAVHDGVVDEPDEYVAPHPPTVYGAQKLEAEQGVLAHGGNAVLRLSKVITPGFALFSRWRSALQEGAEVEPFSDLKVSPISLAAAVAAGAGLLQHAGTQGIYQLSSADETTYADLALTMAKAVGASEDLVRPVNMGERKSNAWSPAHVRMGGERLREVLGIHRPFAEDAVRAFLFEAD